MEDLRISLAKAGRLIASERASTAVRQDVLGMANLTSVDPAKCTVHPLNTRDLIKSAGHIEALRQDILERGQLEPAVAIAGRHGAHVLLKGACRAAALKGAQFEGREVLLSVLLLPFCTDLQAQCIINAEQTRTRSWSAWELSLHFDKLAKIHGSNKAIERRIGGTAANIGRARSPTALPEALLDLVEDRHQISARRAAEFLQSWGGADRANLETFLGGQAIKSNGRLSADTLFNQCRRVVLASRAPGHPVGKEAPVAGTVQDTLDLHSAANAEKKADAEAADNTCTLSNLRHGSAVYRQPFQHQAAQPEQVYVTIEGNVIGDARHVPDGISIWLARPNGRQLREIADAVLAALEQLMPAVTD